MVDSNLDYRLTGIIITLIASLMIAFVVIAIVNNVYFVDMPEYLYRAVFEQNAGLRPD